MYEDFTVTDRWTGEPLHCTWRGTIVAIATRHADAVVHEAGSTVKLPSLPVIQEDVEPEKELQIALPGEPFIPGIEPRTSDIP